VSILYNDDDDSLPDLMVFQDDNEKSDSDTPIKGCKKTSSTTTVPIPSRTGSSTMKETSELDVAHHDRKSFLPKTRQSNATSDARELMLQAQDLLSTLSSQAITELEEYLKTHGPSSEKMKDLVSGTTPGSLIIMSATSGRYHRIDSTVLADFFITKLQPDDEEEDEIQLVLPVDDAIETTHEAVESLKKTEDQEEQTFKDEHHQQQKSLQQLNSSEEVGDISLPEKLCLPVDDATKNTNYPQEVLNHSQEEQREAKGKQHQQDKSLQQINVDKDEHKDKDEDKDDKDDKESLPVENATNPTSHENAISPKNTNHQQEEPNHHQQEQEEVKCELHRQQNTLQQLKDDEEQEHEEVKDDQHQPQKSLQQLNNYERSLLLDGATNPTSYEDGVSPKNISHQLEERNQQQQEQEVVKGGQHQQQKSLKHFNNDEDEDKDEDRAAPLPGNASLLVIDNAHRPLSYEEVASPKKVLRHQQGQGEGKGEQDQHKSSQLNGNGDDDEKGTTLSDNACLIVHHVINPSSHQEVVSPNNTIHPQKEQEAVKGDQQQHNSLQLNDEDTNDTGKARRNTQVCHDDEVPLGLEKVTEKKEQQPELAEDIPQLHSNDERKADTLIWAGSTITILEPQKGKRPAILEV